MLGVGVEGGCHGKEIFFSKIASPRSVDKNASCWKVKNASTEWNTKQVLKLSIIRSSKCLRYSCIQCHKNWTSSSRNNRHTAVINMTRQAQQAQQAQLRERSSLSNKLITLLGPKGNKLIRQLLKGFCARVSFNLEGLTYMNYRNS